MMRVTLLAVLAWAVVLMGSCFCLAPNGPTWTADEKQYLGMTR